MNKAVVWLITVLYLMFFEISNTAFALNPNGISKTREGVQKLMKGRKIGVGGSESKRGKGNDDPP
ncbi:hypothetical protein F2Q69_00047756 [Brassica cretica]|uniref:Uncharacterized protein n=1 Tax=Brassica cretica TaxID=69181 RepID=A0A8S9PP80_BRACR|nr:hypothetical protein F2Q69_00047756 [Brassica cretica]